MKLLIRIREGNRKFWPPINKTQVVNLMKVNIEFQDDRWKTLPLHKIAQDALTLVAKNILREKNSFEVSILASNDFEIRSLNNRFRRYNSATNILSWPEHEYYRSKPGGFPKIVSGSHYTNVRQFLGNLAISYDSCSIESKEANVTVEAHITHLLIHGCLHLVGFDHQNEPDALLMEGIEKKLLAFLGIKNPYELIDRK